MSSEPTVDASPNCGAALYGPYCASCGQRQVDLDHPFVELVAEGSATFLALRRIHGPCYPPAP